jgi:hypothetical protein
MAYIGANRRVHTCFITRNREYHIRSGTCVAVRDRETSAWIAGHSALGMRLIAAIPGVGFLGHPLEFVAGAAHVRTSSVTDILRPNRNEVDIYGLVHGLAPS